MCAKCGCQSPVGTVLTDMRTGRHVHLGPDGRVLEHDHLHGHAHPGTASEGTEIIRLERDLLSRNERIGGRNRGWLAGRGARMVNLMGSPGAGKTSLIERTIADLGSKQNIRVVEGDQETTRDAERIRAAGGVAVQINTGTACHLDATMVERALQTLDPAPGSIVIVENVGNLICPALFDLGENARAVIAAVTDGEDKPEKYPHMFRSADIVLLNKIDLSAHVRFSEETFERAVRSLNPRVKLVRISAARGDGMEEWYRWLQAIA